MKNVIYYGDDHYEAYCDCPGGKNSGNDSDGGGSNGDINEVLISAEEPTDPNVEIWVDTDEDPSSLPMDDAPEDGKLYARLDKAWSEVKAGGVGQVDKTPDASSHGEIFNSYEGEHINKATGLASHAEGYKTTASGAGSHSEGAMTIASGNGSHAEGGFIHNGGEYAGGCASGDGSHAEGALTTAKGTACHSEGFACVAGKSEFYCMGSHAEGVYTTASGSNSHAEGSGTNASGYYSHAEGLGAIAGGIASHAEGANTTASGIASHSQNTQTTANGFAQTSIGYNNTPEPTPSVNSFDATKLAFVVGGGSPTENKNVFEVYFNGNVKYTGTMTGPTADYAEMFEWIDNNPLGTDRVGRFVNLVGKKIELATKDSKNIIGIISGNPVVLGDAPNSWQGMYINDKWGRPTYTDHEFEIERQKFNKETGKIEKVKELKKSHARSINQRYDSSLLYVPREERSEWAAVGMLGKLLVLQDGTLNVGDYCYPSQDGIATKSEKGWYVMDVIDKEQALVLFK